MSSVAELRPLFVMLFVIAILVILLSFQDRSTYPMTTYKDQQIASPKPVTSSSSTNSAAPAPAPTAPMAVPSAVPVTNTTITPHGFVDDRASDVPVDFNEDSIGPKVWNQQGALQTDGLPDDADVWSTFTPMGGQEYALYDWR